MNESVVYEFSASCRVQWQKKRWCLNHLSIKISLCLIVTGHPEETPKQRPDWAAVPDRCSLWVPEEGGGGAHCAQRTNCEILAIIKSNFHLVYFQFTNSQLLGHILHFSQHPKQITKCSESNIWKFYLLYSSPCLVFRRNVGLKEPNSRGFVLRGTRSDRPDVRYDSPARSKPQRTGHKSIHTFIHDLVLCWKLGYLHIMGSIMEGELLCIYQRPI